MNNKLLTSGINYFEPYIQRTLNFKDIIVESGVRMQCASEDFINK